MTPAQNTTAYIQGFEDGKRTAKAEIERELAKQEQGKSFFKFRECEDSQVNQTNQEQRSDSEQLGEPVAVMELHSGGWDLVEDIDTDWLETLPFGTKLYTTPQQRKPLTDNEICNMVARISDVRSPYLQFARAIEAAHGIKE